MMPQIFQYKAEWDWVRHIYSNWVKNISLFYQNIEEIFLEFDTSSRKERIPLPLLFISLNKKAGTNFFLHEFSSLMNVIGDLGENKPHLRLKTNLLRIFNDKPEDCHIFGIGFLLARRSNAIRICMISDSFDPFLKISTEYFSTEQNDYLKKYIKPVSSFFSHFGMALNVGEKSIEPVIGLELYPGINKFTFAKQKQCIPALDFFVREGLCSDLHAQALLNSHFRERNIFNPFMQNIMNTCSISHFKFNFNLHAPPEFKVYLAYSYLPVLMSG